MPVMCGFDLRVPAAATLSGSHRRRRGFFAHRAVCRWRGRTVRLPEAKKRRLRPLGIVPVALHSKTRLLPKAARDRRLASGSFRLVIAENASYVRLRSSRLSSGHAVRLPEAKKRLLRALSIAPVAVLSKARLLLKAARDRRFASGSFRLVCSVSLSASIFAESFSTLSHKEKL
ncbi:unnamed protein product [Coccothraustes coccothraustes]